MLRAVTIWLNRPAKVELHEFLITKDSETRRRLFDPSIHPRLSCHRRIASPGTESNMEKASKSEIKIAKNGPYIVTNAVPLSLYTIGVNEQAESVRWEEGKHFEATSQYALCRCGQSNRKPFCDGTHAKTDFDGTETASRAPYARQAKHLEGETVVLHDAEHLCAFARFCDRDGSIWRQISETSSPRVKEAVEREASHCPSGRLVIEDKHSHIMIEPHLPESIGLVEDPAQGCSGPLWVRGGISITSADGEVYEVRNRVTLCRCGQSSNKPFCDGSHASVKFQDGLA
jgi:CDGSH-type Zn-finger protein